MYKIIPKCEMLSSSLQPQPDFFVLNKNSEIVCGLWTPLGDGIIGHFRETDPAKVHGILDACCQFFVSKGYLSVLGPMNSNTWYSYRFVSWSSNRPPFFLEPSQPIDLFQAWVDYGFLIDQSYISSEQTINSVDKNKYSLPEDLRLSFIDLDHFESELELLYIISTEAFADNIYYANISKKDFLDLYLPLRSKIQNKNMLLIKDSEDEIAGYLFGLPDLLQNKPDTYIIKTLAISPKRQGQHLGSYLVNCCMNDAYKAGYRKIIHALMHENNNSAKIGKGYEIIRRYSLLRKNL